MALQVGQNDSFERQYMAKFRALSASFGEFVEYERDRAGRDIGLNFVSQTSDGGEIVDPSLVWFQMKGIQASSFSSEDFNACKKLTISLKLKHLQFWYIAPDTTYLALYIEAVDKFFVLNIQDYIQERYGDNILTLSQETLTVHVSKDSVLDEQSFYLIKQRCSVAAWRSRIAEGEEFGHVFFRDATLVRRLSTALERGVFMQLLLRKYGSKLRSEAYFMEISGESSDSPEVVREHWQYMMPDDLSQPFPYLDFNPLNESDDEESFWDEDCDSSDWPPLSLPNGKQVLPDGVFEQVEYKMSVSLNDIGEAWAQTLHVMHESGFIELDNLGASMVSVAPWHARDV